MSLRATHAVDVYKGEAHIGELSRTEHGARFAYRPEYVEQHLGEPLRAAAFSLPLRASPYEVVGTNLHAFFAGLLPEGLRLRALVRELKTSEDDLFSLLVASGADAIGDVCIAETGTPPKEHAPTAEVGDFTSASFEELFEASLRYNRALPEPAIAGVQPKLSAGMMTFPVRGADKKRSYILKLTPEDYPKLAENETFFMAVAKRCGFQVARTKLVHDRTSRSALLVERFDRVPQTRGPALRVHQEDACQLLGRYPADKYRLSLDEVAQALDFCTAPIPERLSLLRLQALSYLVANGDLHGKNVSVQVVGTRVALTPVYDFLSTLPYGDQTLSLSMEGRDANLKRAHFIAFGERVGLRRAAVEMMLEALCKKVGHYLPDLSGIGLGAKKTSHLERVMRKRLDELGG